MSEASSTLGPTNAELRAALSVEQRELLIRLETGRKTLPLDPGVASLVLTLWWHGIPTWSSCEGHPERGIGPHVGVGFDDGLNPGEVRLEANLAAACRIMEALRAFDLTRNPHPLNGLHLMFSPAFDPGGPCEARGLAELRSRGSHVAGLFAPIPRSQTVEIIGAMQAELLAFCRFLRVQPRGLIVPELAAEHDQDRTDSARSVERAAAALEAEGFVITRWSEGGAGATGSAAPSLEFNATRPGAGHGRGSPESFQEQLRHMLAILRRVAPETQPVSFLDYLSQLHVDFEPGPRAPFTVRPQGSEVLTLLPRSTRDEVIAKARSRFERLSCIVPNEQ